MHEVRIPAFAKINLRLDILGKRPDGYHELRTIFQTISLKDELTLRRSRHPGISLTVLGNDTLSHEPVQKNLVYRAVDALRHELKIRSGVEIELRKKIPAGGGLGGGSSDAAAALLGYLRLNGKKIPPARLIEVAALLGADVPFFLFGGRALGVNRGDEIYPLGGIPKQSVVVVVPDGIRVPTADAFRWVHAPSLADSRSSLELVASPSRKGSASRLHVESANSGSRLQLTKSGAAPKLWEFCALCWSAQGSGLANDFERPVFQRHPRLGAIKRALLRVGAAEASLAGSGSAVFGLFPSPALARRAAVGFPEDQAFVCETISRDSYVRMVPGAL
jgi:4-diphosphocytidyl-2-C-methyl-D-erythritol kinase